MIRFTQALILTICITYSLAAAETDSPDVLPQDVPGSVALPLPSYTEIEGLRKSFSPPAAKTFSLNLVPKLVKIRALYFEREESASSPVAAAVPSKWGRYFDLLATSAHFGEKLVGEGEISYSALGNFSFQPDEQPTMSRLGLRGSWQKLKYGLGYRSFGSGFVSLTGLKVDHPRDENELWGEYDFQSFRVKTTLAEWREKKTMANQFTLTRTASTSLNWGNQNWNALISSSYSLMGTRGNDSQAFGFTNGLSLAYHPSLFITVQPDLSFREEWDHASGLRTETPSVGIAVIGTLDSDLQLIGRASYANGASEDPLKDSSTMASAAGLNWKLGRSFLGEQSLSFQLEYKNEMRVQIPTTQQANLSGTVQFKLAGF